MVSSPAAALERNSADDSNPREHGDITNSTGSHNAFRSPSTIESSGHYQEFLQIRGPFRRCFTTFGSIVEKQDNIHH